MLSVMAYELINVLKDVKSVVDKKHVLPILQRVKFAPSKNSLVIEGYNLSAGVQRVLPAKGESNKPVALVYESIFATLSKMKQDERIDITFNDETFETTFTQGKRSFTSKGMDGSEFPVFSDVSTYIPVASLDSDLLKKHVDFVIRSTTTADNRLILTGISFEFGPDKLTLAGADGYMLHVSSLESNTEVVSTFIPPAKAFKDLLKVMLPGQMTVSFQEKRIEKQEYEPARYHRGTGTYKTVEVLSTVVLLSQENRSCWIQCIEGRFPDYECIIPRNAPLVDTLSLAELKEAISFVKETADDNASTVKFAFGDDQITLSAKSETNGEVSYTLKENRTTPIKGKLAASYELLLQSVMGLLEWGTTVEIKFTSPTDPIVLGCPGVDNVQAIVMPMSIGGGYK